MKKSTFTGLTIVLFIFLISSCDSSFQIGSSLSKAPPSLTNDTLFISGTTGGNSGIGYAAISTSNITITRGTTPTNELETVEIAWYDNAAELDTTIIRGNGYTITSMYDDSDSTHTYFYMICTKEGAAVIKYRFHIQSSYIVVQKFIDDVLQAPDDYITYLDWVDHNTT